MDRWFWKHANTLWLLFQNFGNRYILYTRFGWNFRSMAHIAMPVAKMPMLTN